MKYETKDGGFSSLGEFLVKVRKAYDGEIKDGRLIGKTAGHMEESEDTQGGFLAPELWADEIYHAALERSIVRSRAVVLPAKSDSLKVRRLQETDRSSSLFGGITFTWTEERGSKATAISKPALGQCELSLHKLVGGCFASNELEDDYGKFGDFMKLSFGQAIRFVEDDAFINGSGAGQPQGIVGSGFMITVARQQPNEIVYEDIVNLITRLLPGCWDTAVFLFNPDTLGQILSADAVENNVRNIIDVNERKLFGFPFILTEKCQSLGTEGDIILADFANGHYLIADREMRIAASRHVSYGEGEYGYKTDETFWKVVLRVDGQPLMDAPIAPYCGADTLSAFVTLTDFVS